MDWQTINGRQLFKHYFSIKRIFLVKNRHFISQITLFLLTSKSKNHCIVRKVEGCFGITMETLTNFPLYTFNTTTNYFHDLIIITLIVIVAIHLQQCHSHLLVNALASLHPGVRQFRPQPASKQIINIHHSRRYSHSPLKL